MARADRGSGESFWVASATWKASAAARHQCMPGHAQRSFYLPSMHLSSPAPCRPGLVRWLCARHPYSLCCSPFPSAHLPAHTCPALTCPHPSTCPLQAQFDAAVERLSGPSTAELLTRKPGAAPTIDEGKLGGAGCQGACLHNPVVSQLAASLPRGHHNGMPQHDAKRGMSAAVLPFYRGIARELNEHMQEAQPAICFTMRPLFLFFPQMHSGVS